MVFVHIHGGAAESTYQCHLIKKVVFHVRKRLSIKAAFKSLCHKDLVGSKEDVAAKYYIIP